MERNKYIETNSSMQIKMGAIMSYIAIFFNIATGLIYTPWMIKKIGQSEYGLYTLALTIISFFTIDFGLGEAVSRFLSKYNVENNEKKKKDFLGLTFKIYILIDFIIFFSLIVILIFSNLIYVKLTASELSKFRIVFSIAALYSIASFPFMPLNGILISYERFAFQKFMDLINKILTVITMVLVLILNYKLYSLVIVNAIVGVITIIIKLNYIIKNNLVEVNFKARDKMLLKEIYGFSIWTALIAIAQRFILNITPTILAAFSGSIQISIFAVAMTIEGYTWTFANALNGLFLPKVTRMTIKNNEPKNLENLMIKVGRIQLFLVGLLIVGIFTMGKEFMILWMGNSFLDSYYVTILLIAPCIITLTQQIGNTALVAINEIKYRAFCSIIVAVISTCLSMMFTHIWGAIGAGIAILFGNIIGQVLGLNIVYSKVLKIDVFRFFKECHLKLGIPILLTCFIGFFMQYNFPVDNLLLFLLKACSLCIIYFIIIWAIALNKYEKELFSGFFIKIIKNRRNSNV